MDVVDRIHNVPVPERFLPIVFKALAEAYRGEASVGVSGFLTPVRPPADDTVLGWTKAEVMSVYHESTQSLRVALDYLTDRAGQEVWARELAHAVYPDDSEVDAESRLYGVLGAFGSRVINKYGKDSWFFRTWRGSPPDESRGHMIYTMPPKAAWWVQEASGRLDSEQRTL